MKLFEITYILEGKTKRRYLRALDKVIAKEIFKEQYKVKGLAPVIEKVVEL
tara:strand:- start:3 stop:155 length:153 start_codon:yes stop_codon:yes gene_type:complete